VTGDEYTYLEAEAHRAIGRWIVEFSLLMEYMRTAIVERLNPDPPILADLALGEATANQIASVFFGMCRQLADLDKDEVKIAARLQARMVHGEIERRNDIAHGDWWIDTRISADAPAGKVRNIRIRPARKEGPMKVIEVTPDELDDWSGSLAALRDLITEYGYICLGARPYAAEDIRVRDIFVMKSGEIAREGPRAAEFERWV
jgi:hypothetical protein